MKALSELLEQQQEREVVDLCAQYTREQVISAAVGQPSARTSPATHAKRSPHASPFLALSTRMKWMSTYSGECCTCRIICTSWNCMWSTRWYSTNRARCDSSVEQLTVDMLANHELADKVSPLEEEDALKRREQQGYNG